MAEESKQLTKRQQKAIDTAALIRRGRRRVKIWHSPTPFCARSVCPVLRWQGVSLCAVLVMHGSSYQAGWIDEGSGPVEQPLPYGAMPRLTFAGFHRMHCATKRGKSPSATALMSFFTLWGWTHREPVIKRCVHKCRRWPRVVCSWALRAGPITASLSNSLTPGSRW